MAQNGESNIDYSTSKMVNNFNIHEIKKEEIKVTPEGTIVNVIEALDGELITNPITATLAPNLTEIVNFSSDLPSVLAVKFPAYFLESLLL